MGFVERLAVISCCHCVKCRHIGTSRPTGATMVTGLRIIAACNRLCVCHTSYSQLLSGIVWHSIDAVSDRLSAIGTHLLRAHAMTQCICNI